MDHRNGEGAGAGDSRRDPSEEFSGREGASVLPQKDLLRQYRSARSQLNDRLDLIEVLSHWKLELQARLARKEIIFLYADSDVDFGPLADEVRDFVRVSKILTWMRGRRP